MPTDSTERRRVIYWPAVIKFRGDDELAHIGSAEEWQRDASSYLYHHNDGNILIDSKGHVLNLSRGVDGRINAEKTGIRIEVADFIRLVRIHASSSHRCCIEKISFRTVAEGIGLVAAMNDDEL